MTADDELDRVAWDAWVEAKANDLDDSVAVYEVATAVFAFAGTKGNVNSMSIEEQKAVRTAYARTAQNELAKARQAIAEGVTRVDDPDAYWVVAHHRQMAAAYALLAGLPLEIELAADDG
jgi:hypothetical protein